MAILLVEQNARLTLKIAHRAYVIESGEIEARWRRRRAARQSADSRSLSRCLTCSSSCNRSSKGSRRARSMLRSHSRSC